MGEERLSPGGGGAFLPFPFLSLVLGTGLEDAGEITKFAAKEKAEIAFKNLQEAVRILQVEPDMKPVLEDRLNLINTLLSQWEEE